MKKFLIMAVLFTACIRIQVEAGDNPEINIVSKTQGQVTTDSVLKFHVDHADRFTFDIENINGDIRIFNRPGKEITVVLNPTEHAYRKFVVRRYEGDDEAGIYVESRKKFFKWGDFHEYRIDIDVFLPEDIGELKISTVNGKIRCLDKLTGKDIEVSTVNGNIDGSIKGKSIEISAVNGGIDIHVAGDKISISDVNGRIKTHLERFKEAEIENVNGSIRVTISGNLDFEGEVSTISGSVDLDDLEESPFFKKLEKSGNIIGKTYKFILGTGTSRLSINNVNGSIKIFLGGGTI